MVPSPDCSSMREFDKQTLRELHRSEADSQTQNLSPSRGRGELGKGSPSFEELVLQAERSRSKQLSKKQLTLITVQLSNESTALLSKGHSNQEFIPTRFTFSPAAAHTESSGSKRGLARHRNSIGLLTDNHKAEVHSLHRLASKDTPSSQEPYLLGRNSVLAPVHPASKLSTRRASDMALLSIRSVRDQASSFLKTQDRQLEVPREDSCLHILIEPLEDSNPAQSSVNHQVPLISRVPERMMKRPLTSRPLFGVMKNKILQFQDPVLAHPSGDTCGNSLLIPESVIDHQSHLRQEAQVSVNPKLGYGFSPVRTHSSAGGETFLLQNSRRFLDESSVRLQSLRGSTHSLQKGSAPYLLAPTTSLRRMVPDKWKPANSNNFSSFRLKVDRTTAQDQSSCLNLGKSNMCLGQLPAFEVSRMLLVVPGSFKSSCSKLVSPSSQSIDSGADRAPKQASESKLMRPLLDTDLDLGAMIRDCDVLQRETSKNTRAKLGFAPARR